MRFDFHLVKESLSNQRLLLDDYSIRLKVVFALLNLLFHLSCVFRFQEVLEDERLRYLQKS